VHPQSGTHFRIAGAQFGMDHIRQADQNQVYIRIVSQKLERSGNGDMTAMIAPHYIDCYSDVHCVEHVTVVGNCGSEGSLMATKKP
jgi:hypothetical protein